MEEPEPEILTIKQQDQIKNDIDRGKLIKQDILSIKNGRHVIIDKKTGDAYFVRFNVQGPVFYVEYKNGYNRRYINNKYSEDTKLLFAYFDVYKEPSVYETFLGISKLNLCEQKNNDFIKMIATGALKQLDLLNKDNDYIGQAIYNCRDTFGCIEIIDNDDDSITFNTITVFANTLLDDTTIKKFPALSGKTLSGMIKYNDYKFYYLDESDYDKFNNYIVNEVEESQDLDKNLKNRSLTNAQNVFYNADLVREVNKFLEKKGGLKKNKTRKKKKKKQKKTRNRKKN
jgi:hypothetical protein